MTDPTPERWGPTIQAAARSILTDLLNGHTTRAAIATRAAHRATASPKTITNLLAQLGHLGVIDRADPKTLRLTVLGRPWADAWLTSHPSTAHPPRMTPPRRPNA